MNATSGFALRRRATLAWLVLVAATCFSWAMGTGASGIDPGSADALSTLLVVVALVKVRLVLRYFMEVREAALALRILTDLWCLVVGAGILALSWGWFAGR